MHSSKIIKGTLDHHMKSDKLHKSDQSESISPALVQLNATTGALLWSLFILPDLLSVLRLLAGVLVNSFSTR